jgi:hypothetical protein
MMPNTRCQDDESFTAYQVEVIGDSQREKGSELRAEKGGEGKLHDEQYASWGMRQRPHGAREYDLGI